MLLRESLRGSQPPRGNADQPAAARFRDGARMKARDRTGADEAEAELVRHLEFSRPTQ
jgi:hypothetical protein